MYEQQPLGELEYQQMLNIQQLIDGATIAAAYLQPGQTLNDVDTNAILDDLLMATENLRSIRPSGDLLQ